LAVVSACVWIGSKMYTTYVSPRAKRFDQTPSGLVVKFPPENQSVKRGVRPPENGDDI
jgi:hypothetical protein